MPIDTATKRRSVTTRTMPWARALPVSDGSFDRADRLHLLKLYGAPAVYFWKGATTNWNSAANWSLAPFGAGGAGVPDSTVECIVADVYSSNNCFLSANAACSRLLVTRLGGTLFYLNLGAFDLAVGNDFLLAGQALVLRGTGSLTIGRDFLQSADSILYFNLAGVSPTMAVGRDLTVDVDSGTWTPTNLGGHTITVGRSLSLDRSDGGQVNLAAQSAWVLTVAADGGGTAVASNVSVAYSDASGGLEIDASDGTSTDSGNNSNWLFEAVAVAGPYRVAAAEIFHTGAIAAQDYHAGAAACEVFHSGAVERQVHG